MKQSLGQSSNDIAALQLAYDRLSHQAQFQAAFLGTASHELRAPMNQIISLHQLILEDLCENPAEEREFIAQANQAIQKVLKNLDLLISLSKLDIGATQPQFQAVSLAAMFTAVQQLTEMQCVNRHSRLKVTPPAETLAVQADVQWLQQMLILLINGALGAGSRTISLSANVQEAKTISLDLICDSPLAAWQTGAPSLTQSIPVIEVTPDFQYQLATRLAGHLQGTLTLTAVDNGQQTQLCLTLPAVEDEG